MRIEIGLILTSLLVGCNTGYVQGQTVPEGFSVTDVSGPLDGDATTFAMLPDERFLVGNQFSGRVQVVVAGALSPEPVYTVPNLQTSGEQGLLGIAVDPDFPDSNYVYLYHSLATSVNVNRVSKYPIVGDLLDPASDNLIIMEGSGRTLVEFQDLRFNHNGGTLRFASDKTLYISHGDDADFDLVQDLTNLFGVILRINRDGSVPADNPSFDPSPAGARGEIYAFGLRNPFRFAIDPATGVLLVGDVGPGDVEEVNLAEGGENFGWPTFLGEDPYQSQIPLATSEHTVPIHSYLHTGGRRSVIALVTYRQRDFPNDASFPPEYDGAHFFADFYAGPISYLRPDGAGEWAVVEFANGFSRPVDAAFASNGGVYVLEYGRRIQRIDYTGTDVGTERAPTIPDDNLNLLPNHPNPFDRITRFSFSLSAPSQASVSVYDMLGRRVTTLRHGPAQAGLHTIEWDGRDRLGILASPGVYLYRVEVGGRAESRMMVRY